MATTSFGFTSVAPIIDPIPEGSNILGISLARDNDAVLTTIQGIGLQLQQFSDQNTRASITFPRLRQFQCHAVQHRGNGSVFAAVSSPPQLCMWSSMESRFTDALTIQLPDDGRVVQNLCVLHHKGVFVTLEDGTCVYVDETDFNSTTSKLDWGVGDATAQTPKRGRPVRQSKRRRQESDAVLLWTEVVSQHKANTQLLISALTSPEKAGVQLRVQFVIAPEIDGGAPTMGEIHERDVEGLPTEGELLTACFQNWRVIFFWSDGSLITINIGDQANLITHPTHVSTPFSLKTIAKFGSFKCDIATSKPSSRSVVMQMSSSGHVLIVGEDKHAHLSALIWDTNYCSLQAQIRLDDVTNVAWKSGHGVVATLKKNAQDAVVIALSSSVIALNGATSTGTLASVLNTMSRTRTQLEHTWDKSFSTPQIAHTMEWKFAKKGVTPTWFEREEAKEKEIRKSLRPLLDPKLTPTIKTFSKALDTYLGLVDTLSTQSSNKSNNNDNNNNKNNNNGNNNYNNNYNDYNNNNNNNNNNHYTTNNNNNNNNYTNSNSNVKRAKASEKTKYLDGSFHHHALQIVNRALADSSFLPVKGIVRILKRHCLSYCHCPHLIEVALGESTPHRTLLQNAIVHLDGINETVMLSCFEKLFARRHKQQQSRQPTSTSTSTSLSQPTETKTNTETETELESFLRLIYCRGWNESTLISGLVAFNVDMTIFLLGNLKFWLGKLADCAHGDVATTRTPSLSQIVEWVGYVIDAKFAALISSADSHDLLNEINTMVLQQTDLCESVRDMPGLIAHFVGEKPLPRPHGSVVGEYSIEVLNV